MLLYFSLLVFILYTMYIYFISLTISNRNNMVEGKISVGKTNTGLSILFLILVFMSASRGINIGTDTGMYYSFFYRGGYEDILEWGFIKIYDISRLMGNFNYWLFITSFITLFFVFLGIKRNTSNYLLSIFFFVSTYVYFFTYNGVRQALAAAIVFAFLDLLINKNKNKILLFFIIILSAMLFHNSAFFLLVLLLIPTKKVINEIIVAISFVVATGIYFSKGLKNEIGNFISDYFSFVYSEKYVSNIGFFFEVSKGKGLVEFLPVFFQMIILIYAVIFIKKNKIKNPLLYLTTNIYIFYLCLYGVAGIEATDRFQNYLQFFNIYFLSLFSMYLLQYKKNGVIYVLVIANFFILYFVLRILRNTSGVLGLYY